MKHWLLTLMALLCLLLVFAGCSDEEDNDYVAGTGTSATPYGFVHGSVYLDPDAYIDEMFIFGYGAVPPNLDSMKIGDSLLYGDDFFDYDYDEDYHENYWTVTFDEDGSNYMYDHGDTAVIRFYGDGTSSMCNLKILDADDAEIDSMVPGIDDDTVSSSESLTAHWTRSDGADYYAVWLEFTYGNNWDYIYHYTYTTDTFYTVSSSMYPDSLRRFYVTVTPFTGPDPSTGEGNVTGSFLTGKVFSFGWSDYTRIQGWYTGTKGAGKLNVEEPRRKEISPAEIINNIYKQYE